VLGYVGTVAVEGACVRLPVPRAAVGADGTVVDPRIRAGLVSVVSAFADHLSLHASAADPS